MERFGIDLELNEKELASDNFVMLRRIFYTQLGVLLFRQ